MGWKCRLDGGNKNWILLDFKLSPCSVCCILSFGWFSGVWILRDDVSKHSVSSVFIGGVSSDNSCSHHLWRWNSVFRNVGTYNSDAGEWPKWKNTTKLKSLHNIAHGQIVNPSALRYISPSKQITCNSDPSGPHSSEYTSLYVTLHHTTDAADTALSNRPRTYKMSAECCSGSYLSFVIPKNVIIRPCWHGVTFYAVPRYDRCPGMARRTYIFYVIKLPCSGTG